MWKNLMLPQIGIILSAIFFVTCGTNADTLTSARYVEERAATIQTLIQELKATKDATRQAEICFILGEMRAEEAINELISRLQFEVAAKNVLQGPYQPDSWSRKPAQEALIKIGAGAFPRLLQHVANTDNADEQAAALRVMRIVLHRLNGESVNSPDGANLLKIVLSMALERETDPNKREHLQHAISTATVWVDAKRTN